MTDIWSGMVAENPRRCRESGPELRECDLNAAEWEGLEIRVLVSTGRRFTFSCRLLGTETCASVWRDLREAGSTPDRATDALVKMEKAGEKNSTKVMGPALQN